MEETNVAEKMEKGKVYEVSYLLLPTIPEEGVAAEVGNLKEVLEKRGAVTISDEYPKMIDLAYSMSKTINNKKEHFTSAYSGWVKFDIEQNEVPLLNEELAMHLPLLRFLLVKTVRENTISSKRVMTRDSKKKPSAKKEEGAEEINKEELDKQIDAMTIAE
jgi:ribosomal protein S6